MKNVNAIVTFYENVIINDDNSNETIFYNPFDVIKPKRVGDIKVINDFYAVVDFNYISSKEIPVWKDNGELVLFLTIEKIDKIKDIDDLNKYFKILSVIILDADKIKDGESVKTRKIVKISNSDFTDFDPGVYWIRLYLGYRRDKNISVFKEKENDNEQSHISLEKQFQFKIEIIDENN